MNDKQKTTRRHSDDVAQTHTKMLRVLRSRTLDKDEVAERMTTTIETDDRTHSFETFREDNGAITTHIRTVPTTTAQKPILGAEKKEVAAA